MSSSFINMNVAKGVAILCFFSILLGSCFDPPEFDNSPKITFRKIAFIETPEFVNPDSLVVTLDFEDGNGDLGLPSTGLDQTVPTGDHFLIDNNGQISTIEVETVVINGNENITFFHIPNGIDAELMTYRVRERPGYDTLPPPVSNSKIDCRYYLSKQFVIEAADLSVMHPYASIEDTITTQQGTYFKMSDTLFFQTNPSHYNIEVDFFVKAPDGSFQEFSWLKEYCSTYDGRFPVLADSGTALEGTIIYAMTSVGFRDLFAGKRLKLQIRIKDRALNVSNVVDTQEFTLDAIQTASMSP